MGYPGAWSAAQRYRTQIGTDPIDAIRCYLRAARGTRSKGGKSPGPCSCEWGGSNRVGELLDVPGVAASRFVRYSLSGQARHRQALQRCGLGGVRQAARLAKPTLSWPII